MYEPNYPMEYIGEDGKLLYGDFVRVLAEYEGVTPLADGRVLIGRWAEVEEYFAQERYYVPSKLLRERKQ